MRLLAISDLHLANPANRQALAALPAYPEDWLIVAGDVSETQADLAWAWTILTRRFARVLWAPGNHELWSLSSEPDSLRGEAKYQRLVALCREFGVLTPEDPYVIWPGMPTPHVLAPLFLLYDYTFRPDHVAAETALEWAAETNTVCADEIVLHPDHYPSREVWCMERCHATEGRLQAASAQGRLVLINHFPLRYDLVKLPRIPRFSLWCGTRRTEDWHTRFPVAAVVYGHLHVRSSQIRDGVRFEEVSLGYPKHWRAERGIGAYLREILPGQSESGAMAH
jgi:3',5'-cyclic AMP phosphodiesterase CpdA